MVGDNWLEGHHQPGFRPDICTGPGEQHRCPLRQLLEGGQPLPGSSFTSGHTPPRRQRLHRSAQGPRPSLTGMSTHPPGEQGPPCDAHTELRLPSRCTCSAASHTCLHPSLNLFRNPSCIFSITPSHTFCHQVAANEEGSLPRAHGEPRCRLGRAASLRSELEAAAHPHGACTTLPARARSGDRDSCVPRAQAGCAHPTPKELLISGKVSGKCGVDGGEGQPLCLAQEAQPGSKISGQVAAPTSSRKP